MEIDQHILAQIKEYIEQWRKNEIVLSAFEIGDIVLCNPGGNLGVIVEIDQMEGTEYVAWYNKKTDEISISYGWDMTLLERPARPAVEPIVWVTHWYVGFVYLIRCNELGQAVEAKPASGQHSAANKAKNIRNALASYNKEHCV